LLLFFFLVFISWSYSSSPPLGWNSWDCYTSSITEDSFRSEAKMFSTYLQKYGWEFVVIDGGWDRGTDGFSRTIPDPNTWPSSKNGTGLKAVSDYVHSLGLKFGLHLMRGIHQDAVNNNEKIYGTEYHAKDIAVESDKCVWSGDWYGVNMSHPAAAIFYQTLIDQMVSWGVEFIKVDCVGFGRDQHNADIIALSNSIKKSGKPIIFSLSPGADSKASDIGDIYKYTDMYRITDDLWDCWDHDLNRGPHCNDPMTVFGDFALFPQYQHLIALPGLNGPSFPDGDMLPIGNLGARNTSLSRDEQYSLMTLWAIFRNPLMFGGRLTEMDPFTLSLLTNSEVLKVNQESSGNTQVRNNAGFIVWKANSSSGDVYVALFNTNPTRETVSFTFSEVGTSGTCNIRDLWVQKDLGTSTNTYHIDLNPRGAALLQLSGCKANVIS